MLHQCWATHSVIIWYGFSARPTSQGITVRSVCNFNHRPDGHTGTSNHDASGDDTTCEATICGSNEKVVNHACVACPTGKISTGNHDASGGDAKYMPPVVAPMRRW